MRFTHGLLAGERGIFCSQPQFLVPGCEARPGLADFAFRRLEALPCQIDPVAGTLEALREAELERFLLFSFQRRTGAPERGTPITHEIEAITFCAQEPTALVLMLI